MTNIRGDNWSGRPNFRNKKSILSKTSLKRAHAPINEKTGNGVEENLVNVVRMWSAKSRETGKGVIHMSYDPDAELLDEEIA
jgi:hypothetical protein